MELGWDYYQSVDSIMNGQKRVSVQDYEKLRPSEERRNVHALYMFLPTRVYHPKNMNYTDEEIAAAVREKQIVYNSRQRSNSCCRMSPAWLVKLIIAQSKRERKVKRALRNLKKKRSSSQVPSSSSSSESIYRGWWIPLSAHFF
jgi:hypothetical protein